MPGHDVPRSYPCLMFTDQERLDRVRFQRRVLAGAIVLLALAAVLWLTFRLSGILFMVFVSVFAAVALEPPVHYLAKRGWRRGTATGVVFLSGAVAFDHAVSLAALRGES